ncbi:hypothetical protein BDP27DRAFT_1247095 [Rhodocollybia butyracea]|uniref:Uncharacterized protein n=1 Tax=Rhodocollybia butyracea TaxID=206335 RepID=A0A9P5TWW1_9AGAR|nr:hypothetical protein BDP27DRAFT_1247095 [Rhodocollybia butyracea]
MPCFEGLLPETHDGAVQDLLWNFMMLHGFAKFDMHLDSTVAITWALTCILGDSLQTFSDVTCAAFTTKELPSEKAAQVRQAQAALNTPNARILTSDDSLRRWYKLDTPKLHAVGYIADDIAEVGVTGSHSTFIVSIFHFSLLNLLILF